MDSQKKTNSNAIISLVMGIISFFIPMVGFFLAVIGIVFAVKARKTIRVTNEAGNGLAIAGLICSIVSIFMDLFAILGLIAFMIV